MYAIHTAYILQFEFWNELAGRKFIRRLELPHLSRRYTTYKTDIALDSVE